MPGRDAWLAGRAARALAPEPAASPSQASAQLPPSLLATPSASGCGSAAGRCAADAMAPPRVPDLGSAARPRPLLRALEIDGRPAPSPAPPSRLAVLGDAARRGQLAKFAHLLVRPGGRWTAENIGAAFWLAASCGHLPFVRAGFAARLHTPAQAIMADAARRSCVFVLGVQRLPPATLRCLLLHLVALPGADDLRARAVAAACQRAVAVGDAEALAVLGPYSAAPVDWGAAARNALARGDAVGGDLLDRAGGGVLAGGGAATRAAWAHEVLDRALAFDSEHGARLAVALLGDAAPGARGPLIVARLQAAYDGGHYRAALGLARAGGPAAVATGLARRVAAAGLSPPAAALQFWAQLGPSMPTLATGFWSPLMPRILAAHLHDTEVLAAVLTAAGPAALPAVLAPEVLPCVLGHTLLHAHPAAAFLHDHAGPVFCAVALAYAIGRALRDENAAAVAHLNGLWGPDYPLDVLPRGRPQQLREMVAAAVAAGRGDLVDGWERQLGPAGLAQLGTPRPRRLVRRRLAFSPGEDVATVS